MRNTSETDYDVIKYNHMSAQTGILNSLVTRVQGSILSKISGNPDGLPR